MLSNNRAFVASRILELRDEGTSLEEMGVIYRSHYHAIELQLELTKRNIPYRVQSGVRFFEQAHIKDVISYLRIIVNPRDELAWLRILKMIPSVGNVTANKIFEYITLRDRRMEHGERGLDFGTQDEIPLRDNTGRNPTAKEGAVSELDSLRGKDHDEPNKSEPPALAGGSVFTKRLFSDMPIPRAKKAWAKFVELLENLTSEENRNNPSKQIELILSSGYEEHLNATYENADARIEDLQGLAAYANKYDSTEDFLSELALISTERFLEPTAIAGEDVVMGGEEDELLTLTSVHQSKGLEWNAVFLIWAAEGKFPITTFAERTRL